MTTPALDDALRWLSGQRPAAEALLRALVEVPSFTRDAAGVARVVDRLEPELAALGLATERISEPGYGPHLAFRGPAAGPPVFLIGHSDTVFPPGTFEGFRVDGDRATGPGVFDMKGGLTVL